MDKKNVKDMKKEKSDFGPIRQLSTLMDKLSLYLEYSDIIYKDLNEDAIRKCRDKLLLKNL